MLDSLVRVSRRVGWSTDRFATDPTRPQSPSGVTARSYRTLQAVERKSNGPRSPETERRGGFLGPATCRPWWAITLEAAETESSHLPTRRMTAAEPVVALDPEKVHPTASAHPAAGALGLPDNRRHRTTQAEFPGTNTAGPPVYLYAVSRTLELSLQSAFQLSLTVLVRYRTRASI